MIEGQVLIVQPDTNSAHRLQNTLEYHGYETLLANRGQEAWELCKSRQPQAIVLDTDLPDMSGLDLLRRIRQSNRTRHIHVIALIRKHERNDQIMGLEMGADDSILKPYDVQEVCLRIRNAVRRADTGILVNPATGLPGGRFVEDQLRRLLRREDEWALLRITLQQHDEFVDAGSAFADEDVLRAVGHLLTETLDSFGATDDFVGHSGAEAFIIITSAKTGNQLRPLLSRNLDTIARMTDSKECKETTTELQGQGDNELLPPGLSFDVQMVTAAAGPFQDIMQLASALD